MEYLKLLQTISARRGSLATIFADFVRLAACCLAPRHEVEGRSVSIREAEYMEVIRRYDTREAGLMADAFKSLIAECEAQPHEDVLGRSWLDHTSKSSQQFRGEFYTPPCVSSLMAQMLLDVPALIEAGRPVTFCEPACGAGGMILSIAKRFAPDHWHLPRFTATDINPVACDMTFINTSLWSIPCEVICGNALFPKATDTRWVNLHWVRTGEETRRAIQRLLSPPPALPEPAPVEPEPTKPATPYKPTTTPGWIQDDLFAA